MDFTFGIITLGDAKDRVDKIIDSIISQNIPNFEIIIVGGENEHEDIECVKHFDFDESIKKGWITAKKNLITAKSSYENIVYLHDYFVLEDGWYEGFLEFGDDWDVCMNILIGSDGNRYIDWISIADPQIAASGYRDGRLVPYDYNKTNTMYVSGGYWVAKKDFMFENPLEEKRAWGESEDYEWSFRVNRVINCNYRMNALSACRAIKDGKTSRGKHNGRSSTGQRWQKCSINTVYHGDGGDPLKQLDPLGARSPTSTPVSQILCNKHGWPMFEFTYVVDWKNPSAHVECNFLEK